MDRFDPYREWLGIEPHEHPPDHYRLLGLARFESDPDAILKAADERMKHVRGFQTGPRGRHTQELLNRLAAAKLCLLDAGARARYDQQLRSAELPPPASYLPVPPPAPPPVPPPAPPPRATGGVSYAPAAPPVAAPARPPSPAVGPGAGTTPLARRTSSGAGLVVTLALVAVALVVAVFLAVRSRPGGVPAARSSPVAEPDRGPAAGSSSGPAAGAFPVPAAGSPTVPPTPGAPVLVEQEAHGDLHLTATTAVLHGEPLRLESGGGDAEIRGFSPENRVEWHFRLVRPGAFLLEMRYLLEPGGEGGQVELSIDDRPVKVRTLSFSSVAGATGSEAAEVSDRFYVAILRSGPHRLSVRAISPPGEQPMGLREIRLRARSTAPAEP